MPRPAPVMMTTRPSSEAMALPSVVGPVNQRR
jgi:hypothetical protein